MGVLFSTPTTDRETTASRSVGWIHDSGSEWSHFSVTIVVSPVSNNHRRNVCHRGMGGNNTRDGHRPRPKRMGPGVNAVRNMNDANHASAKVFRERLQVDDPIPHRVSAESEPAILEC